jgi:hypothetical protein
VREKVSIEKVIDVILEGGENADNDRQARVANLRANQWENNLEEVSRQIEGTKGKIQATQPK